MTRIHQDDKLLVQIIKEVCVDEKVILTKEGVKLSKYSKQVMLGEIKGSFGASSVQGYIAKDGAKVVALCHCGRDRDTFWKLAKQDGIKTI